MKKMIQKIIIVFLIFCVALVPMDTVCAMANLEDEFYVLNSFTGEILQSNIKNYIFSEDNISFEYQNKNYHFSIQEISMSNRNDELNSAKYYSGNNGTMFCNIVVYEDSTCIQVFDRSKSFIGQARDCQNNFTIIISNHPEDIAKASENLSKANIKNIENFRMSFDNFKISPRSNSLHVYANGITIPFILSSGSAEGWCSATRIEQYTYSVTNLRYVIAYAWPSDGISLWYDYNGSISAYQSPAWPSSAYTTVSGTWNISSQSGMFVAEATYTALAGNVPVLYTLYDLVQMNGEPPFGSG